MQGNLMVMILIWLYIEVGIYTNLINIRDMYPRIALIIDRWRQSTRFTAIYMYIIKEGY